MPEIGFSCSTCPCFHKPRVNDPRGFCRRYPPQLVPVPNALAGTLQPTPLFPVVSEEDWCFEHPMAMTRLSMPINLPREEDDVEDPVAAALALTTEGRA